MPTPEMTRVESSLISEVGYDEDARALHVQFKKGGPGIYVYEDVPSEVYHDLIYSESLGRFFLKEIKGVYHGKKIENNP